MRICPFFQKKIKNKKKKRGAGHPQRKNSPPSEGKKTPLPSMETLPPEGGSANSILCLKRRRIVKGGGGKRGKVGRPNLITHTFGVRGKGAGEGQAILHRKKTRKEIFIRIVGGGKKRGKGKTGPRIFTQGGFFFQPGR